MNTNTIINVEDIKSNGAQRPLGRGKPQVKFQDVNYAVSAISIGTVLAGICNIPQGITVNQRTGDTVFWKELYVNYELATQNADIYNTSRVIIFQWHPNSALTVPVVTDILQVASVQSMYDWQYSNLFTILHDKVYFQSGTASNPTASGNVGYFGPISLKKAVKRAEFANGAAQGSQQFYILLISDSSVAPFPTFSATTRITYSQE